MSAPGWVLSRQNASTQAHATNPLLCFPTGARKLTYEDACDRVGGAANLERIRAVKDKYDPHNFFTCHPFRPVLAATPPQGQLHGTDAEQ